MEKWSKDQKEPLTVSLSRGDKEAGFKAQDVADAALVTRVISAIATDLAADLTPAGIGKRAGLSEWEVRRLISLPQFQQTFANEVLGQASLLIGKMLAKLSDAIDAAEKPGDITQLGRLLLATYSTMADHGGGHESKSAQEQAAAILDKIKRARVTTAVATNSMHKETP